MPNMVPKRAAAGETRPAPFQVVQVVYGEPVAQMEFVLLEPLVNFVDRFAVHLHFGGVIGQQPFAHGSGKESTT